MITNLEILEKVNKLALSIEKYSNDLKKIEKSIEDLNLGKKNENIKKHKIIFIILQVFVILMFIYILYKIIKLY